MKAGRAKLADLMYKKGLTWRALARKAGICESTVGRMLAGEGVARTSIAAVAAVFDLQASDLYAQPSGASPPSMEPRTRPFAAEVSVSQRSTDEEVGPAHTTGTCSGSDEPLNPERASREGGTPTTLQTRTRATPWRERSDSDSFDRPEISNAAVTNRLTDSANSQSRNLDLKSLLSRHRSVVVVGDRRYVPARSPSDILLHPGWTDISRIHQVHGIASHDIVADTFVAQDWLEEGVKYTKSMLTCGGADVNFATLLLNSHALFRFIVPEPVRTQILDHFARVRQLSKSREQLQYFRDHDEDLVKLRKQLSPHDVFDPVRCGLETDKMARGESYGLVSLALHYRDDHKPCIVAAGVTGPTTAAAVALLAGRTISDPFVKTGHGFSGIETRPAGGVFKHTTGLKSKPEDVNEVEDDCEWMTPPYTIEQLQKRLQNWPPSQSCLAGFGREDAERLIGLLECLRPQRTMEAEQYRRFAAFLPSGGKSSRMASVLEQHGVESKLDLQLNNVPSQPSILALMFEALQRTDIVTDVTLVTRQQFVSQQRQTATRCSGPTFGITVLDEGGEGMFNSLVTAMLRSLHSDHWVVLLMPDVLISPITIRAHLRRAMEDEVLVAVATSEVPVALAGLYGIVQMQHGKVHRIIEKPGQATDSHAFTGFCVFSPEAAPVIRSYVDRQLRQPRNLVSLLNFLAEHLPVTRYVVHDDLWDCGSPSGYAAACEASDRIAELWGLKT